MFRNEKHQKHTHQSIHYENFKLVVKKATLLQHFYIILVVFFILSFLKKKVNKNYTFVSWFHV